MLSHRHLMMLPLLLSAGVSDEIQPYVPKRREPKMSEEMTAAVAAIRAERLRRKALNFAKRQPKPARSETKGEVK